MKIFHTADWHLGKLVQGVYMTEDQKYLLGQFLASVKEEKPDAIIIAGDLYDRAVPPTEAVHLLNETLVEIILNLKIPVIAIAGNHDSPSRLQFGSSILKQNGLHLIGELAREQEPVILHDEYGEVHFHLVPYADPSMIRNLFADDTIKTHDDATRKIITEIKRKQNNEARHVYVGHAFVTPQGEEGEVTSDSERPLAIGGAEYVSAHHFTSFDYVALGHLHQAHYVLVENIRYAGSLMKYSISEEHHRKGFYIVEMAEDGTCEIEKRELTALKDLRTVEGKMADLLKHDVNDDYVFIRLLDETPIISPMEKIRSVYPNAMHIERKNRPQLLTNDVKIRERNKLSDLDLFEAFYQEVKGMETSPETKAIFIEVLTEMLEDEREVTKGRESK